MTIMTVLTSLALLSFNSTAGTEILSRETNAGASVRVNPDIAIEQSVVSGKCVYQDNWCPGARINLKNNKNELLQSVLVNRDGFQFGGLVPAYYNLEVEYKKKNVLISLPNVPSGQFVTIDLTEAIDAAAKDSASKTPPQKK